MRRCIRRLFPASVILFALVWITNNAGADRLVVPSSVSAVEEAAFYGDGNLDEVVLPEGLLSIEKLAFARSRINSLNLPRSLEYPGFNMKNRCFFLRCNNDPVNLGYQ